MLRRKERWLVGVCTVVLCVMFLTVRDGYGVRRGGGVAAAEAAARQAVLIITTGPLALLAFHFLAVFLH